MAMNKMKPAPTPAGKHPSGQSKNFKATTPQNNQKLADAKRTVQTLDSSARNSMGMAPPRGSSAYREANKTIAKARIQNRQALRQGYDSVADMKQARKAPEPVANRNKLMGRGKNMTLEQTNELRASAGKKPMTEDKFASRQRFAGMNNKERIAARTEMGLPTQQRGKRIQVKPPRV